MGGGASYSCSRDGLDLVSKSIAADLTSCHVGLLLADDD